MSNNIFGLKIPAVMAMTFALLGALLLAPFAAQAATHNINLTAEVLPNGQFGYKRESGQAVIPGPTLFVKQGDTVNVNVINNTGKPAGFKVPGLSNTAASKAGPGGR